MAPGDIAAFIRTMGEGLKTKRACRKCDTLDASGTTSDTYDYENQNKAERVANPPPAERRAFVLNRFIDDVQTVTGHLKTGHWWALQNRHRCE